MRLVNLLVLSIVVSLGAACSHSTEASGSEVLRFSAIPDANTTELQTKFDRVAAYLSEQLGVTVHYVPSSDYGASVEAFKNGDVQLAWFGGLTGVQARSAVKGARAIAQGAVDPRFKSYFIAHESAGIEASDEFPAGLAGMTFTFGSQNSTSGRLMPEHFIRDHTGKSPKEFFGHENNYSKSHDNTAKLVEAGTFKAGALNYKRYDELVANGTIDPERCHVIWVTPEYADYNWTAHPDLDQRYGPGFIDKIQAALIGMKDPALLGAMTRPEGLITASNSDFAAIEELARELEFVR